jgi:hypothetical protein
MKRTVYKTVKKHADTYFAERHTESKSYKKRQTENLIAGELLKKDRQTGMEIWTDGRTNG